MRISSFKKVNYIILSVILVVTVQFVVGSSLVQHSVAALRSTSNFIADENDSRVLFEHGAHIYAEKAAEFLPSAIRQIEERQYRRFVKPVRVYICASRESFKKYYGADVRAGMLTKLFLSPRVFQYGDEIAKKYLVHELSHLHLQQQIGFYKMIKLPMWFKEGLAAYASNGGGAHLISDKQAIESIRAGRYFVPNKADGLIFKTTPSDFGLKPHMFYRQSMMFIEFLKATNESGYRKLLLGVGNGERLTTMLEATYQKTLEELWGDFLRKINEMGLRY